MVRASRSMSTAALAAVLAITGIAQTAEKDIPTVAREAGPSVVRVIIRDQTGKELGSGSGFVVSPDGKMVTNYHVVQMPGTTQAEVRFGDGASYQVEGVLATDIDRDLCVLKIKAVGRSFAFLRLGDRGRVQTGEHVVAIGSPLAGLSTVNTEATVSDGIVSGIRDWPEGKMQVFQITAPVSPGSSGGALLNMNSEVIGVTFAQLKDGQNLNFAIPVDYARPLLVDGPIRPFPQVSNKTAESTPPLEPSLSGTYTGVWQSSRFNVSGAAEMTVRLNGVSVTADIFLTGGELTSETLTGLAIKSGENVWTVQLKASHAKLSVRGVFKNGTFVGDYRYSHFLTFDQGQWILKRE